MSTRYRRRPLSRRDELGALAVSILAGLGGATAAYYITRLYLSRDELAGGGDDAIPSRDRPSLPPPGGTADEGG